MQEILDFSTHTFRCSSLGKIMTEPKGKSFKTLYDEAVLELEEYKQSFTTKLADAQAKVTEIENKEVRGKVDVEKNKSTKAYESAKEKVDKLNAEFSTKVKTLSEKIQYLLPKQAEVNLSDTCISHLMEIYEEKKSGRRKDIESYAIKKGNRMEQSAIELLAEVDDALYEKNTVRLRNDWIEGECDIDEPDKIMDTKVSMDIWTFIKSVAAHYAKSTEKDINKDYWWQGQGYMELYDRDLYELCYCLMNTPDAIITDLQKSILYKIGTSNAGTELYANLCEMIEQNNKYDDKSIYERVFKIRFKRDRTRIEDVYVRVNECRIWLNKYAEFMANREDNVFVKDYIEFEETPTKIILEVQNNSYGETKEIVKLITETITEKLTEAVEDSQLIDVAETTLSATEQYIKDFTEIFDEPVRLVGSLTDEHQLKETEIEEAEYEPQKWYYNLDKKCLVRLTEEEYLDVEDELVEICDGNLERDEAEANSIIILAGMNGESGEETIHISVQEGTKLEPEKVNTTTDTESELDVLNKKVESCKTEQSCIDLYKEIKDKFVEFPSLKEDLTNLRRKYKEQETATKPTAALETEKVTTKKEDKTEKDKEIDRFKELADKATKPEEIRDLYLSNKEFIDANRSLRLYLNKIGEQLRVKQKTENIDSNTL